MRSSAWMRDEEGVRCRLGQHLAFAQASAAVARSAAADLSADLDGGISASVVQPRAAKARIAERA
ncbi:MAG TPA: hypothetical protein PKD49_14115 [Hyphomicrobium sp.]|nr:hypothetical protein [Hyphomicrobium sp.]